MSTVHLQIYEHLIGLKQGLRIELCELGGTSRSHKAWHVSMVFFEAFILFKFHVEVLGNHYGVMYHEADLCDDVLSFSCHGIFGHSTLPFFSAGTSGL